MYALVFVGPSFSELCSKGGEAVKALLSATSEPGDATEDCEKMRFAEACGSHNCNEMLFLSLLAHSELLVSEELCRRFDGYDSLLQSIITCACSEARSAS